MKLKMTTMESCKLTTLRGERKTSLTNAKIQGPEEELRREMS